eukprot:9301199-Lingulodinium_polyedra.AAC.1
MRRRTLPRRGSVWMASASVRAASQSATGRTFLATGLDSVGLAPWSIGASWPAFPRHASSSRRE